MSSLSTLPKGDSAWLLRKSIQRIMQQVSVLETNIGSSTTGNSANTQVIFNDAGTLRGDAGLTYNKTTDLLSVGAATITGDLTVSTAANFNGGALAGYLNGSLMFGSSGNTLNLFAQASGFHIKNNTGTFPLLTINNSGDFTVQDGAGGSRLTLNSTGLGVGGSPNFKLDVAGAANSAPITLLRLNNTGTTGGGPGIAARLQFNAGATALGFVQGCNFASGSIGVQISGDGTNIHQTIDSSGNVGVGVTPSAWNSSASALEFKNGIALYSFGSGTNGNFITNGFYNSGGSFIYKTSNTATRYQQFDGSHLWYNAPAGTAGNAITFTQAMTLDASGNLLVGKSVSLFSTVGVEASQTGFISATNSGSTNATTNLSVYSTGAAAFRFYVGLGGTVYATNTTISAISDARLKENVQDIDVGLGAILALKPRKFDWKAGKGKDIKGDRGFIAQEFEQVFPQLVDEWKDEAPEGEAPYKSVRQDLIPVLVKAIQELTARVQTLETR